MVRIEVEMADATSFRWLGLALIVWPILVACSKPKSDSTGSALKGPTEPSTAVTRQVPGQSNAIVDRATPAVASFQWAELSSDRTRDGVSPPDGDSPAPMPTAVLPGAAATLPLQFERMAGGDGLYCGVLETGPIQCWGHEPRVYPGAFVDVAVARSTVCGVTKAGKVECFGPNSPSFATTTAKRIAASPSSFCTLDQAGVVDCQDAAGGSPRYTPPEGLKAKFLGVGERFACASDDSRHLVCWGAVEGLKIPDGTVVHDLAVGEDFVCGLGSDRSLLCFGRQFDVPRSDLTALTAGYGNLCVRLATGRGTCRGSVDANFDGEVSRFGVGRSAVCMLDAGGRATCHGQDSLAIAVPEAPAPPTGSPAPTSEQHDLTAFLARFQPATLPLDLTRTGTFVFGDRLSSQFDVVLGDKANDYRAGVRLDVPSGATAVTVLHMETGRVLLYTYARDGKRTKMQTLALRTTSGTGIEEDPTGAATSSYSVKAVESRITADGTVETLTSEGEEVTHYVKKHVDGTRPKSRVICSISTTSSSDHLEKDGSLKRLKSAVQPAKASTDAAGCAGAWPMNP